jgi:hypothetical protein
MPGQPMPDEQPGNPPANSASQRYEAVAFSGEAAVLLAKNRKVRRRR